MIDWRRDITWPAGERNPPDEWFPPQLLKRLALTPAQGAAGPTFREPIWNQGRHQDATQLIERLCAAQVRTGLTTNGISEQISDVSATTIKKLLARRARCVSASVASALNEWLRSVEING